MSSIVIWMEEEALSLGHEGERERERERERD
jgi:hypothetical protein